MDEKRDSSNENKISRILKGYPSSKTTWDLYILEKEIKV